MRVFFVFQFNIGSLFNLGGDSGGEKSLRSEPKPEKYEKYIVPDERRAGRPHEMGWFEKLNKPNEQKVRLGQVPPGRIIPDE